jgi:hypothetical protein
MLVLGQRVDVSAQFFIDGDVHVLFPVGVIRAACKDDKRARPAL